MKKTPLVVSIIIALAFAYFSSNWFPRTVWGYALNGLATLVVWFVAFFIGNGLAYQGEPNVIEATHLGMNVLLFNKFEKAFDDYINLLKEHPKGTPEERAFFDDLSKRLLDKHPDEWKRYLDYKFAKLEAEEEEQ